ncbi:hypothetical protein OH77DRAFT_1401029 [Trametes cingulata]|nr:hypothetical protein OH77DRAFT_1401029 [Trametes cingulata]
MADAASCVECKPDGQKEAANDTQQSAAVAQNPLDPSTFVPPSSSITPSITIEFCDRCRWLHRATWVSTELFLTFPTPALKSITILPLNAEDTAGRFRVWLFLDGKPPVLVWDRKVEGSFPELKVLKQRIRDHIQPGKSLGHSDK